MRPSVLTLAVASLALGGCVAPFPPLGFGGMDEVYSYPRGETSPKTIWVDEATHEILGLRLDAFKDRIGRERRGAGQRYRPALLHVIQVQWDRAARALAGGLLADAHADLNLLDGLFQQLDAELADEARIRAVDQASGQGEDI